MYVNWKSNLCSQSDKECLKDTTKSYFSLPNTFHEIMPRSYQVGGIQVLHCQ